MLTEALSAELAPGVPSTAGLSSIAADKVQELLSVAYRVSEAQRKLVDSRKLDFRRFFTLPPTLRNRLQDLVNRPQADFFEIVVEQPAPADLLMVFGRHIWSSIKPLFTESLSVDGVRCLAILVISDRPEEHLRERMLAAEWSPSLLRIVKLDGRQGKTHFSSAAQETPENGGSGIQVRVPVAVLDSMFGRFGQFFGVFTRFNALVVDPEVPAILRELSDFAVLNAPHLLAKVDLLIRQQNDFTVVEAEAHRLHSQIHETTLGFRVIPLDTLFSRFPRMVRDTAQKQGKMVRFEVRSKGIRVDNGMLELLSDPLMHMLRNCIDHGIELPDARERAGKSRTAVLVLSAEQKGNRILVEVGDDGRGIDTERVLEKAIANHLVDTTTAATLSEEQIYRFIFSPGFSTAEKVSDTSGRGVGMDVALVNVTKLGGKIEIASRRGKGTTFSIDIPLSKAIQSMLLAETGVQYVAFPDHIVVEGVVGSREEIQYVNGQRSILLHDRFLPLFSLVELLQLAAPTNDEANELSIVVCELNGRRLGIEVKRILRRSDLLIREMHPRLAKLPGIGGISTIGTDKIVIAVDPEGLFDLARRHAVFGLRTHENRVAAGLF
jgi:chemotaxis protein histidine kinase CheA